MFIKRLHRKRKTKKKKKTDGVQHDSEQHSSASDQSYHSEDEFTTKKEVESLDLTFFKTNDSLQISTRVEDLCVHASPITSAVIVCNQISDNHVIWFGDKLGCVHLCQLGSHVQKMPEKHEKSVTSMCYCENKKRVITGGKDGTIFQWDVSERKLIHSFPRAHRGAITGLSTTTDKALLFAVSSDKKITIWDLQEQIQIHTFYGPLCEIYGISTNQKGCCMAVGADGVPRYYKVEQGTHSAHEAANTYLECVCCLNDRLFICGTAQGELIAYDTAKNKPICNYEQSHSFGFIGDGSGFEKLHNRLSIEVPNQWNGNPVWSICSLSCGIKDTLFATGSCDGYIRIWNFADSKIHEVSHIRVEGIVTSLYFSSESKKLIGSISREPRNGRWHTWTTTSNRIVLLHLESIFKGA